MVTTVDVRFDEPSGTIYTSCLLSGLVLKKRGVSECFLKSLQLRIFYQPLFVSDYLTRIIAAFPISYFQKKGRKPIS